ncbi:valine--tRNA ligase [Natranaeroarchaeum aerophilus]|uniref:Valine--tRNA ligase n=1 Tax=Natranaeroarchaeum aerophilus TaxID=2917711 RepID=A0AAE3FPV7_9EURY|nr:valine--tRNA ligase [Natranaeroarchaeum aerophilus]MCL9812688.1 valine--tRNA ligase [Natranaeroarchaeum aerophilus]
MSADDASDAGADTPDDSDGLDGSYDPSEIEPSWQQYWIEQGVNKYDESVTDPNTLFSIDTPPPTVSGDLHMGHLYQFTLQDFVARFRRMHEETTFFPFGYDDNGIASERLTERELDIRHQDFERHVFQEKCRDICQQYEDAFTRDVQSLAVSVDWDNTYKTIEPRVQRISQLSFIDLYEQGREYRQKAPAIWCPDCETAISQVEMEGAERDSHYNDIAFTHTETGEDIVIATTRPELLPACVAMFVHPDDEDNEHLVGDTARVPIFDHEVPIIADERVDMEKGTGVVMSCTFGDQTDIEWYQAHDLPLRVAIDESGTMTDLAGEYEGLSTHVAREEIVEDLDDEGYLQDRRAISHDVNVHERCETDVEFLVTEQWYVKMLDKKDEYLQAGREMDWYPEKMFTRYKHWIEGLEWDWCISRQRDSGIPIPVWYCEDCGETIVADREDLPVDPLSDDPPVDACHECGSENLRPEEDVFDTWATSSLTPLINAGWDWDAEAEEFTMDRPQLYPFDLRPQGHDIISFWLFHTIVKCYEHTGEVPFDATMINGMVLDENREAMSKSKGNVVRPEEVLEQFPVDAARYWAAGTSIGDDFPFKEQDLVTGEKLLRKLWNASKLVDHLVEETQPTEPDELAAIDEWLLAKQNAVIEEVTEKLENYEFSKARNQLRGFFWNTFCDDYLEIAKQRLNETDDPSTAYALRTAHRRFLTLFAPLLPHITEEIWQSVYAEGESIHTTDWPTTTDHEADLAAGETATAVIGALRRYKSEHQLPLNAELDRVEVYGSIDGFESAISEVMHVGELDAFEAAPDVTTEIDEISLDYSQVGPKFGGKVGEFDAALESGEYELTDGTLQLAGEELDADLFEVREERTYAGEGEMVEADDLVVVVDN